MIRAGLMRWLEGPPLTGPNALACLAAAIAIPTLIRAAVDGVVTGCEFTPYLPFVFVSAILLRWWKAALVALASVAILGALFAGPHHAPSCFIPSAGMFLASSATMIALVVMIRGLITAIQSRGPDGPSDGIVFSLENDEVWASWYGEGPPLRLGSQQRVSRMMKDFLKQEEVGERLNRRP
jgi:hypothetical protein